MLVLLVVVGWWWWRPIRKVCSRRILGRGWPSLRLCWHLFDPLGAILGAMLVHLGTIWAHLGAMLTHLRAMSAQLAAHVGPPAMLGQLRRIWGHVDPSWPQDQKNGTNRKATKHCKLRHFCRVGASAGRVGGRAPFDPSTRSVVGASWGGHVGPSWISLWPS